MRVGIGYDVHAFDAGRVLMLGGVKIEGTWGLKGHSDADVLLHAVADALLGAAALGDLGDHFPDTEDRWKDVPSAVLLAEVRTKIRARGWVCANVDATDNDGATALIWAVGQGHIKIAETLLKSGANVNHQDADGITPLMEAVSIRSEDMVKLLLRNGADARIKSGSGNTAVDIAKKKRNKRVISLLLGDAEFK